MPLGTDVGLGPGGIVIDGDPAPTERGRAPPLFGPSLLWPNGRRSQQHRRTGTLITVSIAIRVSVYLCVCPLAYPHISKFSVRVTCGRGSVLL